jgi:hypothetical protein
MRRDYRQWTYLALSFTAMCGAALGLCGLLVLAGLYGSAGLASKRLSLDSVSKFWLVAMVLLGPCFAIVTHEFGHVAAGWLVGFRFQLFVVGPFRAARRESGQVRLELNRDLALFGGVALSLPTDFRDLLTRYTWFVAGGPVMSLALTVAALAGLALAPGGVGLLPRLAMAWVGLWCGAIGLATAIPMPLSELLITDGTRLLGLLRGGAWAARETALIHLTGLEATKKPPRDWDDSVLATALVPSDGSPAECQARYFVYQVAVDRGEGERAYEHLMRTLELRDTFFASSAPLFTIEAAYFEGWWRGRADEARRWLEQLPARSPFLPTYERLRAEAAADAAAGEIASARARVEEALRLAPIEAVWPRDRLTEMRTRLESAV